MYVFFKGKNGKKWEKKCKKKKISLVKNVYVIEVSEWRPAPHFGVKKIEN